VQKFVPRKKMSKKARKKMDAERRATWAFSPVTKKIENKKRYDRKKSPHAGYDDGLGSFFFG